MSDGEGIGRQWEAEGLRAQVDQALLQLAHQRLHHAKQVGPHSLAAMGHGPWCDKLTRRRDLRPSHRSSRLWWNNLLPYPLDVYSAQAMSADPPTAAADVRAYLHRPEDSLRTAFAHLLSLSTAQLALDTARWAERRGSVAVSSGSCVHDLGCMGLVAC